MRRKMGKKKKMGKRKITGNEEGGRKLKIKKEKKEQI